MSRSLERKKRIMTAATFYVWFIAIVLIIVLVLSKNMIGWVKALITDDFSDMSVNACMAGMLGWAFLLVVIVNILENL